MLYNRNAIVYVCGDAKGLRKDVMNAFINIIQKENGKYDFHVDSVIVVSKYENMFDGKSINCYVTFISGLSFKEANNFVRTLQRENRYLQDVWL